MMPTPGGVFIDTPLSWPDALVCSTLIVGAAAVAIAAVVRGWRRR